MLEDKDGWHIRGKNRHLIVNLVDPTTDALDDWWKLEGKALSLSKKMSLNPLPCLKSAMRKRISDEISWNYSISVGLWCMERFRTIILGRGSISWILFLLIVVFSFSNNSNNLIIERFIVDQKEIDFSRQCIKNEHQMYSCCFSHANRNIFIIFHMLYLRKIMWVYLKHCVSLFLRIYFNIRIAAYKIFTAWLEKESKVF